MNVFPTQILSILHELPFTKVHAKFTKCKFGLGLQIQDNRSEVKLNKVVLFAWEADYTGG